MFFLFFSKCGAGEIAAYVINKARELGYPVSNLKLQKILYYLQGGFTAKYNRPLFNEDIEAWQLGPVVPSIYFNYRSYAAANIPVQEIVVPKLTEEEFSFVDDIINRVVQLTPSELVTATHEEDPWKRTTQGGHYVGPGNIMPIEDIQSFFVAGKSLIGTV